MMPDEDEIVREANSRPNDDRHALRTWVAEARRARASEVEKDAVIKAIADALLESGETDSGSGQWHSAGCDYWTSNGDQCGEHCQMRRTALRLAGRLP